MFNSLWLKNLKVIPVIDVLNGIVVHAVRGIRKEYQPLQSVLTKCVEPLEVAMVLKNLGFSDLYVADLDAIIDCSTNFTTLRRITDEIDIKTMVDAGVTNIGTATFESKNFVAQAVDIFGIERVVVSLDLKEEKILVKVGFEGCTDPIC